MNLQNETFIYILKQYLKGKKDNKLFILLELREIIINKYNEYNLTKDEMKVLLKFLIHGIDTYSFEKAISFQDYIELYLDISLSTYKKIKIIDSFELEEDEFMTIFINNIIQTIEESKTKNFK